MGTLLAHLLTTIAYFQGHNREQETCNVALTAERLSSGQQTSMSRVGPERRGRVQEEQDVTTEPPRSPKEDGEPCGEELPHLHVA